MIITDNSVVAYYFEPPCIRRQLSEN